MTCPCGEPADTPIVLVDCAVDGCPYCTRTVCPACALQACDPLHGGDTAMTLTGILVLLLIIALIVFIVRRI